MGAGDDLLAALCHRTGELSKGGGEIALGIVRVTAPVPGQDLDPVPGLGTDPDLVGVGEHPVHVPGNVTEGPLWPQSLEALLVRRLPVVVARHPAVPLPVPGLARCHPQDLSLGQEAQSGGEKGEVGQEGRRRATEEISREKNSELIIPRNINPRKTVAVQVEPGGNGMVDGSSLAGRDLQPGLVQFPANHAAGVVAAVAAAAETVGKGMTRS